MKARTPGYLQVTRECNSSCLFCSNPQFEKRITFADVVRSINELRAQGITELFLTGGEPTISPLLFKIITYLRSHKITPRMITNGTSLAQPLLAARLRKAGLRSLNISIHSHRPDIADRLAGKRGHFHEQLLGLRNALHAGLPVHVNTTINALNHAHLAEMVDFFVKTSPEIEHYVYNFLDPGMSDGVHFSRAHQNPWIVATYTEITPSLQKLAAMLRRHRKTFRIERVPLCCMRGFEDCSTETRKIVKDQRYLCSFLEKGRKNRLRIIKPFEDRVKVACCQKCPLTIICAGMQEEYLHLHGDAGIHPVKGRSAAAIIRKIRSSKE